MSLKVNTPNDKGNINITIENNLFSKNKSGQNKKRSPVGKRKGHGGGASGLVESVRNPYEPEPSFLSEIKTAMNERNFYGMKFNPRPSIMPPMYNNWYDTHSRSLQIEEMDDDDERLPIPPRDMIEYEEVDEDDEIQEAEELKNVQEYGIPPSPSPAAQVLPQLPSTPAPVPSQATAVFDQDGKYIGGEKESSEGKKRYRYHMNQRNKYTNGFVKPQKKNIIRYGLQKYFG